MRTGAGSRALATVALAAGATGLALLLFEGALRLHEALGPEPPPPPERVAPAGLPRLRSLKDLVRPDTRGVFKGVLHRTNSRGVRGPEYAAEPAPGTFRIVMIGDSYTMGQGVAEEDAYPAVTGRLLEARFDDRDVEVINLGVAGLAIRHSIKRLRRIGMAYRPHLVVYGFTPNDILGPDYVPGSDAVREATRARIHRFDGSPSLLLRTVWPRLVMLRSALWPLPGTYEHELEENYFRNPAALRQITDGLDQLASLTGAAGICGFVFVHTRMNQLWLHPLTRIYRRVAELARERGLGASVSFPFFRGRDAWRLRLSAVDSHPNEEGHRLHARALADGLQAMPDHCWQPGHFRPRPAP